LEGQVGPRCRDLAERGLWARAQKKPAWPGTSEATAGFARDLTEEPRSASAAWQHAADAGTGVTAPPWNSAAEETMG